MSVVISRNSTEELYAKDNEQACLQILKGKGKAVPLQVWTGPEGSRKLRFPDFMKTAQDGGKVVSLTHPHPGPAQRLSSKLNDIYQCRKCSE
jgi:hypothetical protein